MVKGPAFAWPIAGAHPGRGGSCVLAAGMLLLGSLAPGVSRTLQSTAFVASAPVPAAAGTASGIGRESFPATRGRPRDEAAELSGESGSEKNIGEESLFVNPRKAERLLSTMRKIEEGTLRAPTEHAVKGGLNITEERDAPPQGRTLLQKLYRKWRLENKKPRTVEEVYPDEACEKQRKRLVRKTVTNILNLAAQQQHQIQTEQIAERERTPLPAPSGLKSLGWTGDARFKVPEAMKLALTAGAAGPKSSGGNSRGIPAKPKPVQKRSPKDEVIKRIGELLRDKEWVRRVEAKMKDKNNTLRQLRRLETRHARRVERAISAEMQAERAAPVPAAAARLDPLRGGAHSVAETLNLALRGGAGIPSWVAALLPTSYDSTTQWLFAIVKIFVIQLLKMMGVPSSMYSPYISPLPSKSAGTAAAGGEAPPAVKELSPAVKEMLASTKYDEPKLKNLKGQFVGVVTNNLVFAQEDIDKVFHDADAPAPPVRKEAVASLMRLAQDSHLFLITQFPHSGLQNLTSFWESRTEQSDDPKNPHGSYYTDRPESLVLQALQDAELPGAGYVLNRTLFCETVDGRGYIARVLGERAPIGRLALYADDNVQSVEWFQNVCRNTTVVAMKTEENGGNFLRPKHAEAPVVVSSLDAYFTKTG